MGVEVEFRFCMNPVINLSKKSQKEYRRSSAKVGLASVSDSVGPVVAPAGVPKIRRQGYSPVVALSVGRSVGRRVPSPTRLSLQTTPRHNIDLLGYIPEERLSSNSSIQWGLGIVRRSRPNLAPFVSVRHRDGPIASCKTRRFAVCWCISGGISRDAARKIRCCRRFQSAERHTTVRFGHCGGELWRCQLPVRVLATTTTLRKNLESKYNLFHLEIIGIFIPKRPDSMLRGNSGVTTLMDGSS